MRFFGILKFIQELLIMVESKTAQVAKYFRDTLKDDSDDTKNV